MKKYTAALLLVACRCNFALSFVPTMSVMSRQRDSCGNVQEKSTECTDEAPIQLETDMDAFHPINDSVWKSPAVAHAFLTDIRGAIPLASTQMDTMLRVIANYQPSPTRWLDLGCGDGVLGRTLLQAFPRSEGVLMDFSEPMLEAARKHVGEKTSLEIVLGDYSEPGWQNRIHGDPFDVIVSGFSIHHQPDEMKQRIYNDIFEMLSPGGVFLNLEHVKSTDATTERMFEESFIDAIYEYHESKGEPQSRQQVQDKFFSRADKDANILSPVEDQCKWLRDIGFQHVDCYFKHFEIALFGGVRSDAP